MPPLRGTGFIDHMAERGQDDWAGIRFSRPRRSTRRLTHGRPGCAYHGFCGTRRLPHQREEFDRGHDDSRGGEDQEPDDLRSRARHADCSGSERARNGRRIMSETARNSFSPPRWCCLAGYTYENSRLLLLSKSRAYPNGLSNNHGQVGKHFFAHYQTASRHRRSSPSMSISGTAFRPKASPLTIGG